jgi:hypothetical protein
LSSKEQLETLKGVAIERLPSYPISSDYQKRYSAVTAIAAYGDTAIPTLIEVSQFAESSVAKIALDWIAKLKSQSPNRNPKVIKDLE